MTTQLETPADVTPLPFDVVARVAEARRSGFSRRFVAETADVKPMLVWRIDHELVSDDELTEDERWSLANLIMQIDAGAVEAPRRGGGGGGGGGRERATVALDRERARIERALGLARQALTEQRESKRVRVALLTELVELLED